MGMHSAVLKRMEQRDDNLVSLNPPTAGDATLSLISQRKCDAHHILSHYGYERQLPNNKKPSLRLAFWMTAER
jgi:hypothetical protein